MGKRMIVGVAALALLAVVALSALGTYAYPSASQVATASGLGDCDRDRLQVRLQTRSMDCDGTGDCANACEQARLRTQAQLGSGEGAEGSGAQYQLMQQSRECLMAGGQAGENAVQARNQVMAQIGGGRP